MAISLYAEEYGHRGTPLLLLHGLGGGVSTWQEVANLLASDHHVVVPDLLGFGRIAGHSVGAILAAEFAARPP